MTIGELLKQPTIASIDAELLLCHILHVDRSYIKSHNDHILSYIDRLKFFWFLRKRKKHLPLAYITGQKEFFGLDFFVNKHTLVPRPETEHLVELVLFHIATEDKSHILLIDIGTGSGCIPISILASCSHKHIHTYASDISQKALRVAARNANKHLAQITFAQGSLLTPWTDILRSTANTSSQIIITANLPYITELQWKTEPSIQKEPKSALVANEQGLALYRHFLQQISSVSKGQHVTLFFEIDPDQERAMTLLADEYLPPTITITFSKDLQGHTRVVMIHL
jgi:release factor glutamine methyltransferase